MVRLFRVGWAEVVVAVLVRWAKACAVYPAWRCRTPAWSGSDTPTGRIKPAQPRMPRMLKMLLPMMLPTAKACWR